MTTSCPETAVLSEYLAGRIAESLAHDVESHLRSCQRCRQTLAQSRPRADALVSAVHATTCLDSIPDEPELVAALKLIGALHSARSDAETTDSQADTGRIIRDYELQRKLGEGGMGSVYLARHLRLKKPVALKLLRGDRKRDDSAIARFQVEIEVVGKLEHPHIVRALDAGEDNGTHYLVMEYLAGIDVARLVRGISPIGLADACELIRQAALGLQHAHENNVVHRDVKPSNLMLLAGGKVKVLDLGLAHFRPDWSESVGLTRDNQVLGTLLYVAPEQLVPSGTIDARSDIYSLGVTLIEVLLGRVPPKQGVAVTLAAGERATRTDVPPDIWRLAERMTAIEPADRPTSMLAVAEVLRPWCVGANLPQLLARLAGRTSFADARLPGGMLTPVVGDAGSAAIDATEDFIVQGVIPPPITGSMAAASGQSPAASEIDAAALPPRRAKFPRGEWLAVGGVLALLLIVGIPLIVNALRDRPDTLPGPSPRPGVAGTPPQSGGAMVTFFDPTYEALIGGILDQRKVIARQEGTNAQFVLHIGTNDNLPAGNYTLQGQGDDWEIAPETFTVVPGETTEIMPRVRFRTLWKYPRIPEPGQQVVYAGSLTRRAPGAAAAAVRPTPFALTITALADKDVEGVPHRWVQLEIAHKQHDYRETAYLLVNVANYPDQPRLIVKEGWIEGTSQRITAALARRMPEAPLPILAAKFEPGTDSLLEAAGKIGARLPPDRIGIHVPLVLLFGGDYTAAEPLIRSARALMPAPTRFELGNMDTGRRIFPGLVITAEDTLPSPDPEAEPLRIELVVKRSETIPFSFVNVHLDSPALAAELKVDSHTELNQPLAGLAAVPTEQFAIASQMVLDLDSEPGALDVATLPRVDGEGVNYHGVISLPTGAKLPFDVELRLLGGEAIDSRPYRWLSVVAVTKMPGSEHREEAVLLIDENEFRDHGKLAAPRGWFKTGPHWLPLTTTDPRPIETIEEDLCFLDAPLPAMRLGVHDVLALVTKTSLQSMFGNLRTEFASWSSLKDATPKLVPEPEYDYGSAGKSVAADVWTMGEKGTVPSFEIVRSHEIPFDFVNVEITTDMGITLTSSTREVVALSREELARISLPNAAAWEALVAEHRDKVEAARQARPNWRLWTIRTPEGLVVRQWLEHGGHVGDKFLLRDPDGGLRVLPLAALDDDEDRQAVREGRWWHSAGGTPFLRGELITYSPQQGKTSVTIRRSDGDRRDVELTLTRFEKTKDRALLQELAKLLPSASSTPGPLPPRFPKRK